MFVFNLHSCHLQFPCVQHTPLPQAPFVEMLLQVLGGVGPEEHTPLRQVPPVQAVPSTRLVMGLHVLVAVLQPPPVWQVVGVGQVVGQPAVTVQNKKQVLSAGTQSILMNGQPNPFPVCIMTCPYMTHQAMQHDIVSPFWIKMQTGT
jgi:hypothetical protein